MTKQIVLFLFVFISLGSFAQNRVNKDQLSENWKLINSIDGVNFYAKYESADLHKNGDLFTYAVIKIENKTDKDININFLISGYYDFGCEGCVNGEESTKTLFLKSNEVFIGSPYNNFARLVKKPIKNQNWIFEGIGVNNVKFN